MKLVVLFLLFFAVAILLLTNHPGLAIRITTWIFYVLVMIAVWKFLFKK